MAPLPPRTGKKRINVIHIQIQEDTFYGEVIMGLGLVMDPITSSSLTQHPCSLKSLGLHCPLPSPSTISSLSHAGTNAYAMAMTARRHQRQSQQMAKATTPPPPLLHNYNHDCSSFAFPSSSLSPLPFTFCLSPHLLFFFTPQKFVDRLETATMCMSQ